MAAAAYEITGWRQRLPRQGPCDRVELLLDLCRGKRVVHVGFVDERRIETKLEEAKLSHTGLAASPSPSSASTSPRKEWSGRGRPFLRAMRELLQPDGPLVVTTPNAYRLLDFLAPASGSELIHPDHTGWHSPTRCGTSSSETGGRSRAWPISRTRRRGSAASSSPSCEVPGRSSSRSEG